MVAAIRISAYSFFFGVRAAVGYHVFFVLLPLVGP